MKVKIAATETTFNFDGSGSGTFSTTLERIPRHEQLQITANVSGIDPARTDVVTVDEIVKLRPNLRVMLDLPPVALPHVPVDIAAIVEELYGDTGARANCVLLVDGSEVDRANDIWINARGEVTCRFSHTFDSLGTKRVAVAVTDVVPGEYDPSNNIQEASLEVVATQGFDFFMASASDINFLRISESRSATREDYSSQSGWRTQSSFYGFSSQFMENLDQIRVGFTLSSDGQVIENFADLPVATNSWSYDYPWGYASRGGCAYTWAGTTRWFYACSNKYTYGDGVWHSSSSVTAASNAGDVTYHSRGWDQNYLNWGYDYWTWNTEWRNPYGTQARYGNEVTMDVMLTDGQTTFTANPTITFQPHELHYQSGWCADDGSYCWRAEIHESGKAGSVRR